MALLLSVVKLCALGSAICMFAMPTLAVLAFQRGNAKPPASSLPYVAMAVNCSLWILYGFLINELFPLVAANVVGLGSGVFALHAYYAVASAKAATGDAPAAHGRAALKVATGEGIAPPLSVARPKTKLLIGVKSLLVTIWNDPFCA